MKKAYHLVFFLILASLVGCSQVRVSQDYDLSRNFSGISSYDFRISAKETVNDPRVDNTIMASRFKKAMETAFLGKGFRKKTDGNPDFYVDYHYRISSRIESDDTKTGVGFGVGSSGGFGGISLSTGVNQYDEGFLIINLIDPATNNLLWRGNGSHRFKAHTTPEKREALINELVSKILAQFPPQKK